MKPHRDRNDSHQPVLGGLSLSALLRSIHQRAVGYEVSNHGADLSSLAQMHLNGNGLSC
jgi:hypothetical protein